MNNIHYLIIGLALLFAILAIAKPSWPCLPVAVILIAIELFSRVSKAVVIIGLTGALMFGALGCAHLDPGARPIVVRTEQSITVGNGTLDAAVHIDDANRSFFKTNLPPFHSFCEWLRTPVVMSPLTNTLPRGLAIVESADAVKNQYKASNSTNDYTRLLAALATLETATAEAQKYIVQTSTPK